MFGIKMRIDHWKNRAVDTTPDINTTEEHLQPEGLFPFAGNPRQPMPKGIAFDLHEYIQLVDWTGRQIRDDKRGSIASDALPIIQRINISTDQWLNLCTHFESRFFWLEQANFESLEHYSTESIADKFESDKRYEDMVWRLKLGDNWVYLYLLLEFQSAPDRWMALRLLTYTALLWEKLVKAHDLAPGSTLPPVLPVVLYNGEQPWNAETDLAKLCYPAPTGLLRFQPKAHYLLLDESKLATESAGLRNFAAVLFRLEFSESPLAFRQVLQELARWVGTEAPRELQRSLYLFIVKWLKNKTPGDYPDELENFEESIPMLAQRIEQWENQFLEKGREEGREEGLRIALHRLLENKFGPLSDSELNQIKQADSNQLDGFLAKVLNASSINEVLDT